MLPGFETPEDAHDGGLGWRRVSHANLSRRAGWVDVSAPTASQRWCRATRELVRGGWLRTCTVNVFQASMEQQITVPLYQLGGCGGQGLFEQLPRPVLARLAAAGADTGVLVRHWLAWRMSAGARGWTGATIASVAACLGVRAERVSQVLGVLEGLEVVSVLRRPGRSAVVSFDDAGQDQPTAMRVERPVSVDTKAPAALEPAAGRADVAGEDVAVQVTTMGGVDGGAQLDQAVMVPVDSIGGPTPDLSDRPPSDCRIAHPRSVGHVLDSSSHQFSHSVAKPVGTVTQRARANTAALRPSNESSLAPTGQVERPARRVVRFDAADRHALRIVAGLQDAAEQPKLRGQLRRRIATLLRRYPDIDPMSLGTAVADAFEDAAASPDGLGMRHIELVNRTVANLRADQLAVMAPAVEACPVVRGVRQDAAPVVTGPRLVELIADHDHVAMPGCDDDATEWAIGRIAAYVQAQDPGRRARALELYPRYLQQQVGGHYAEIHFATQIVARALANETPSAESR